MVPTNTPATQQEKDFIDTATELVDKVAKLGATFTGNPFLMGAVELLGRGIRGIANGRNIDTGPFDAHMASIDATVAQAITDYAEYQKRHAQPPQQ